jgi:polyisoprenoid-binding protein YceI
MKAVYTFLLFILLSSTAFAKPVHILVDVGASEIKWKGAKEFTDSAHNGTIKIKKGHIIVDDDKITGGEFVIDMTTIKDLDLTDASYRNKLENHLISADFFDTAKYPEAKYVIKTVSKSAETTIIEGTLTVKDIPQPMRMTANIQKEGKVYTAKGAADFDRTKHNVMYSSTAAMPNLIKTGKDKIIKNTIELNFIVKTVPEEK